MPRSGQPSVSPVTAVLARVHDGLARRPARPEPRAPAAGRAHPSTCAAKTPVAEQLERPRGARVDLDHPGVLAVPHEVDAEQPDQSEVCRQPGAERLCGRPRLGPRQRDVPAPGEAARAERRAPDQLLGDAEHGGAAPVADRGGRTRAPLDPFLDDRARAQSTAAPLAHAAPAAAAQRLAQPAPRAIGAPGFGGGVGGRVVLAQRLRQRRRVADARAASPGRQPSSSRPAASRATRSGRFSSPAP